MNKPTTATYTAEFLVQTQTISRWVAGGTVDTAELAAELRRWAEHFEPLALDDDEAEAVLLLADDIAGEQFVAEALSNLGVVLRWEQSSDRRDFALREDDDQ